MPRDSVWVEILSRFESKTESKLDLTVCSAMLKDKKMDGIYPGTDPDRGDLLGAFFFKAVRSQSRPQKAGPPRWNDGGPLPGNPLSSAEEAAR